MLDKLLSIHFISCDFDLRISGTVQEGRSNIKGDGSPLKRALRCIGRSVALSLRDAFLNELALLNHVII